MADTTDWLTADDAGPGPTPKPKPKTTAQPTIPSDNSWLTQGGPPAAPESDWLTQDAPPLIDTTGVDTTGTDTSTVAQPQPQPQAQPELSPIQRSSMALTQLQQLLNRPDITAGQRQRINDIIHAQRLQMANEQIDTPDPLFKQLALSTAQGALSPTVAVTGLARKLLGVNAPTGLERFYQGITPTADPNSPIASGLAQAGGEAAGGFIGTTPYFKLSQGIVGVGAERLAQISPEFADWLGTISSKVTENVSNSLSKVVGEYSGRRIALGLSRLPFNLTSGVVMQAMTDPSSLKTSKGMAVAALWGAAGTFSEGKELGDLEDAAVSAAKAADIKAESDNGQNQIDPEVAAAMQQKADEALQRKVRITTAKAWNALQPYPELRKAFHPDLTEEDITAKWGDLSKDMKQKILDQINSGVKDAAAKGANEPPTVPPPVTLGDDGNAVPLTGPGLPTEPAATAEPVPPSTGEAPASPVSEAPPSEPTPRAAGAPPSAAEQNVKLILPLINEEARHLAGKGDIKPEDVIPTAEQHVSETFNNLVARGSNPVEARGIIAGTQSQRTIGSPEEMSRQLSHLGVSPEGIQSILAGEPIPKVVDAEFKRGDVGKLDVSANTILDVRDRAIKGIRNALKQYPGYVGENKRFNFISDKPQPKFEPNQIVGVSEEYAARGYRNLNLTDIDKKFHPLYKDALELAKRNPDIKPKDVSEIAQAGLAIQVQKLQKQGLSDAEVYKTIENEQNQQLGKKGKVVGSIAPQGELDDHITRLEAQLKDVQQQRDAAERRAQKAERDANTDPLTGFQTQAAWEKARPAIEADPTRKIIMWDLRNVHPHNELEGFEPVNERFRTLANTIRSATPDNNQHFRIGGDEFVSVVPSDQAETVARYVQDALGNEPIKGTNYPTGVRYGIGQTFDEADAAQRAAKQGEDVATRGRPVISQATPSSEASPEPDKPLPSKLTDPRTLNSKDALDDLIDEAEKLNEEGKLSDEDYGKYLEDIGARKMELDGKRIAKAKPAKDQPARVTRNQMDKAAVQQMTEQEIDYYIRNLESRKQAGLKFLKSDQHDLTLLKRERLWRLEPKTMTDAQIDVHMNNLQNDYLETMDDPSAQSRVVARVNALEDEMKRRAKPNPTDIIGNEGGFLLNKDISDPLEARPEPGIPEYSKRIQDKLAIDMKPDETYKGLAGAWGKKDQAYANIVRTTHALDVIDRLFNRANDIVTRSAGKYAELMSGSYGRAQRSLEDGSYSINPDGSIVPHGTRGLKAILKAFKGRVNQLRRYLVAARTLEIGKRGLRTGIEPLDATREVSNAKPDVVAAAKDITAFMNGELRTYVEAGMLSPETYQKMLALGQSYAPLHRLVDAKAVEGEIAKTVGAKIGSQKKISGARGVLKRLSGAESTKIIDPLRSMVDQVRRMRRAGDMNRLAGIIVQMAETRPDVAEALHIRRMTAGGDGFEPEIIAAAGRIVKYSEEIGSPISPEEARDIALQLNTKRLSAKSDKMYYWREGKREVWQVPPEVAQAIQGLQPQELHFLVKVAGFLPNIAKAGITDNPAFAIFNAFRDSYDATIQSKYGFTLGIDSMRGLLSALTNDAYHREWKAAAGTAGGIASRAIQSTEQSLQHILPTSAGERAVRNIVHPIQFMREMSVPFEEAGRLGEYIKARQAGASAMDAALASQRVTTNFKQAGLQMQGINHIVMFMNPAIQSLDTNIRALISQPARALGLGALAISLPSVYLWAANHDDQEIQELRKSQYGAGYWYFRYNGNIHRMPKPFVFGQLFGTSVEDALDKIYDNDPTAGKRFIDALWQQVGFNIIPTVMNFTLGLATNKDFSTGGEIAPNSEGDVAPVDPGYRARPSNGPTSRALGEMFDISPAKIEFAVRNGLGTLGSDALHAIDMVNDARYRYPAAPKSELPIIGRMLGNYPSASVYSVQRFYNDADRVSQIGNTLKLLEKRGDANKIREYVDANKFDIATADVYADTRKQISTLRSTAQAVAVIPANQMSPAQKKVIIDNITKQIISVCRQTNDALQQAREKQK